MRPPNQSNTAAREFNKVALTDDAHALIADHFHGKPKRLAVDATCGNGHDIVYLAELGFTRVVGFDVQQVAIDASNERVNLMGLKGVELFLAGHQSIEKYLCATVDCVMFNFGYLPKGDKNITTDAKNSVKAIYAATRLLDKNGLISLMCYPGHLSGAIETEAIRKCFAKLGDNWTIETHLAISPKPTAPILYMLKRK